MNTDPDFELSADMRLIELQRASLGLAARDRTTWQTRLSPESGSAGIEEPVPERRSAVLSVQASATPAAGVIPGAVVTLTLSIANEGAAAARGVIASVPIPGAAAYRPGSFVQDGRSLGEERAERFFSSGLDVAEIAPGARSTFVWKIGIRLGTGPLVVAPAVRANDAAVIGARTLAIPRKEKSITAFAAELERTDPAIYSRQPLIPVDIPANDLPFYELDQEETLVHEAAAAALSPAVVKPEPEPERAPALETLPSAAALPDVAAREAVVLYGRFDRTTIAFFERTFNGSKPPTILSHCVFGSALACSTDVSGNDGLLLKRHLDAQSQVLHRMQLHERLGKKEPIAEYAGALLADLDSVQPAPVANAAAAKDTILLETELSEPTLAVLAKINEDRERWDFVKARQLTLALQAQRVAGMPADSPAGAALENALRVYAQNSMTALQKLFVRLRIDRTTGVLFQNEPQLDAAARALVTAFAAAIR